MRIFYSKIIKYILGKLERFNGGLREVNTDSELDTIEHILPKNPGQEWGEDNYDFDSLIYRLGNMCLLEKKYNKDLQNASYNKKSEAYLQSSFVTTSIIPTEYTTWDGNTITKRQQKMGKCAKSIWKIEF